MSHDRENDQSDPVDLSALDAFSDPRDLESFVRRVLSASGAELARRRASLGWGGLLLQWRRPILIASALLALISTGVLLVEDRTPQADQTAVIEALGIGPSWAQWITSDEASSPAAFPVDGAETR